MKQIVLFKNAGLIVHGTQVREGQSAKSVRAILQTRFLKIPLEAAAAEVLVGYLQVLRAYLANAGTKRQQVPVMLEQMAAQLEQQLKFTGRTTANYEDVKKLIEQVGCLHDWATKGTAALRDRESQM